MWDKYTLDSDKVYFWKFGNSEFWIRKIRNEWQIANKGNCEQSNELIYAKVVDEPDQLDWKSFIADENNTLNLVPALPDRPVVVRPQKMFKLLPNKNIQLFVHVPLWIQFYSGSANMENFIYEFPSFELSSTWFGDHDNGVLSFSLRNSVHIVLERNKQINFKSICPVKITNDSPSVLDFQRLSIQVEFLSLYGEANSLYTNEIEVKFRGENIASDMHYSQYAPSFLENPKHLSSPRNPEESNVLRKSIYFIKSLTDY